MASVAPPSLFSFLVGTCGIYVAYITYGIIQEWVYQHRSDDGTRFSYTLTLLFIQASFTALVSAVAVQTKGGPSVPVKEFALPGATYILAMLCSNEALKYVSYPTQVLAKSSKLVPVLLSNVIIYRRKQTVAQYICVGLVTLGIFIFRWKVSKSENENNSAYGLLLLAGSLFMDGLTGPAQEHLRDKYKPNSYQYMLYCNAYAVLYIAGLLAVVGEGTAGFEYILDPANRQVLQYILLFSLCGAVGQFFIFMVLRAAGSLALTTVTTTRKFFTILASVLFFGHILTSLQWFGVLCVFVGLGTEAYDKYRSHRLALAASSASASNGSHDKKED